MTDRRTDVVIIGASFAGLFAAAAAQSAGAHVLVLERDRLRDEATARPGVPQGDQPHVLLHRGLIAAETLLPGLRDDLLVVGAVPFDSGEIAWLSPDGWLPTGHVIHEIVSLSRPLLELVVRRRVLALDGVEVRTGSRVQALSHDRGRWRVTCAESSSVLADTVIDASGRSSRMPHWLDDLGISAPEPLVVEAKLGYATRRFRSSGARLLDTGIVIAGTPQTEAGAAALPVENDEWLVCAAGYGARRPGRTAADFDAYLRGLSDPVLADFTALLEPIDDVHVHRQTANRRHRYERARNWPAGLLVVGDALTSFNPVYGQGITVAARQGQLLAAALGGPLDRRSTARLQRRLARVADFPWAVATGEDVRYPSCNQRQTAAQRVIYHWSHRVNQLGAAGDTYCRTSLGRIYHLMAPGILLFRPRIVGAVVRSMVTGVPPPAPRPAVLDPIVSQRQPPLEGQPPLNPPRAS